MNQANNKLEKQLLLGGDKGDAPVPFSDSPHRVTPAHVASTIATYVRAMVILVFWGVVGAAALCAGWVAFRIIWWAGSGVLKALGV